MSKPIKVEKINLQEEYTELYDFIKSDDFQDYAKKADLLLTVKIKIKQIRQKQKLTQKQIAEKSGVEEQELSRLLSPKFDDSELTQEEFRKMQAALLARLDQGEEIPEFHERNARPYTF